MNLDDARRKCEAWRRDYNEERPHSAISNKAPIELNDRSELNVLQKAAAWCKDGKQSNHLGPLSGGQSAVPKLDQPALTPALVSCPMQNAPTLLAETELTFFVLPPVQLCAS
jgi:Integrase core domain